MKFYSIHFLSFILIYLKFKLIKSHGNFNEIQNFKDISNLVPIETYSLNNNPTGTNCLLKCNKQIECNAVTSRGLECKSYAILRDNFCMTNYTLINSTDTTFYLKVKRKNGKKCKKTEECHTEFGFQCINQTCQCNSSQ